jgi:predicted nucleic-acid-binding protein
MIAIDANVLLRYVVADDPVQARRAARLIESRCTPADPGFVDRVALCEMVWVLRRTYRYTDTAIARVIDELLASTDIEVEDREAVRQALQAYQAHGVNFTDALIAFVNRAHGCEATATFDRRAARLDAFVAVP